MTDQIETKSQKFMRLGESRMTNAVKTLRRLPALANTSAYEWTDQQVETLIGTLDDEVAKIKSAFDNAHKSNGKDVRFTFND